MRSPGASRILVCASQPGAAADVRRLLEQAGYAVGEQFVGGADGVELAPYQVVVLESSGCEPEALQFCRRLRAGMGESIVPILFVTSEQSPATRLASFEAGADTYLLRPFAPGELLAQVQAFLRIKEMHDRLTEKTAEVLHINKRLQQAYQQFDDELELARKLQLSFLPQSLPELPHARFAVKYRLCGRVGGDFYDAFRLDENHVGFYVADAMGHGVPASLLTVFIKRAVQAKEIFGKQYRLLPPNEVLRRLNRELVEQALSESPFITMVYALLNFRDGMLQFARAGHPHPLYLPHGEEPRFLQVRGSLLGVFDTEFTVHSQQLRPGDRLLLYSDGIDEASVDGREPGAESLLACATRYRELLLQDWVDRLTQDLLEQAKQPDDLTFLAVEMSGEPGASAGGRG